MKQSLGTPINNQLATQLATVKETLNFDQPTTNQLGEIKELFVAIELQEMYIASLTNPNLAQLEIMKLNKGCVKGSRIRKVNSVAALKTFLNSVDTIMEKTTLANGLRIYRLAVPNSYKAETCWVRLQELGMRNLVFKKKYNPGESFPEFMCQVVVGYRRSPTADKPDEAFFYAPKLNPMQTNVVTFVVDQNGKLCKWFPGEDKERFPATADLKSHWVNCCKPSQERNWDATDRTAAPVAVNKPESSELHLVPRPIGEGRLDDSFADADKQYPSTEPDEFQLTSSAAQAELETAAFPGQA